MQNESKRQNLNFTQLAEEEQLSKSQAFYRLLKTRRSVRHFSDRPVNAEIIRNLIATAGTAPSGANMQPWHFIVVTDPKLKAMIRKAAEKEEKLNYDGRFPKRWLDDLAQFGTNFSKPYLEKAPALIVIFKIDYDIDADGNKVKHYYVNESVGIATGLLITAIHNAGLVTVTHTPSPMKFLQEICKRPKNEKPFMLLPIGYPDTNTTVPIIRKKQLEEIMQVNPS